MCVPVEVDSSGDGKLDFKEFTDLLENLILENLIAQGLGTPKPEPSKTLLLSAVQPRNPKLQVWLAQLDIETTDLKGLFQLLGLAWTAESCVYLGYVRVFQGHAEVVQGDLGCICIYIYIYLKKFRLPSTLRLQFKSFRFQVLLRRMDTRALNGVSTLRGSKQVSSVVIEC